MCFHRSNEASIIITIIKLIEKFYGKYLQLNKNVEITYQISRLHTVVIRS